MTDNVNCPGILSNYIVEHVNGYLLTKTIPDIENTYDISEFVTRLEFNDKQINKQVYISDNKVSNNNIDGMFLSNEATRSLYSDERIQVVLYKSGGIRVTSLYEGVIRFGIELYGSYDVITEGNGYFNGNTFRFDMLHGDLKDCASFLTLASDYGYLEGSFSLITLEPYSTNFFYPMKYNYQEEDNNIIAYGFLTIIPSLL